MRRGRRVRRVIRRIDPWSVLKVSVLFWVSFVIVLLIGAVILWSLAQTSGAVGKVEKFMNDLGFSDFKFQGKQIFRLGVFGGIVFVVAGTVFTVIMAFLYNLISDLVGGVEVQVLEEEAVFQADQYGRPSQQRPVSKDQRRQQKRKPPPGDRRRAVAGPNGPPGPGMPAVPGMPGGPGVPGGPPPLQEPQPQPQGPPYQRRTVV